jgi:hypothetical protein
MTCGGVEAWFRVPNYAPVNSIVAGMRFTYDSACDECVIILRMVTFAETVFNLN